MVEVVPLERRNRTGYGEYDEDDDDLPGTFIPIAFAPFNIDFRSLFTGLEGKNWNVLQHSGTRIRNVNRCFEKKCTKYLKLFPLNFLITKNIR